MGKNKGKHGKKTSYARFQSIMAKLNNQIEAEKAAETAENRKKDDKNANKTDI